MDYTSYQPDMDFFIHQMRQAKPDWNAVGYILRKYALVFPLRYSDESNALHAACAKNAPFCVIQLLVPLLLKQLPGLFKEKNTSGDLPLHLACGSHQSFEVIQFLVKQCPDTVTETNNDGNLPLHKACAQNQSIGVIQWLVQQLPDAVKKQNSHGDLPLHSACTFNQSLEVIQCLVKLHPNTVKAKNGEGDLPLHKACARNQSLEVIQLLVQQHPCAVKKQNSHGDLPLHSACTFNQSLEVIQCLVQQHSNTVKVKDGEGDLPLDLACAFKQPLAVIQWLVQQHPDAVKESRKDGNRPLHVACARNQTFKVIEFLVQQNPGTVKEKNSDGNLPLHVACANEQSFEVIACLVQKYPNAVKQKSKYGNLPLHLACFNEQSFEVIEWLVQKHRNAVKEKTSDGWLPLHLACWSSQPLKVIQLLVQQDPDTIKEKSNDGHLPLHLACAHKRPLEVIAWLVQQHPNHVSEKLNTGPTPCDLARHPAKDQSPDPKTVEWLEAVESGQINLTTLPPAPPLQPWRYAKKLRGPPPPTGIVVDTDLAKPSTAATNDVVIIDRCSIQAVLEGKNDMVAVSQSYVESIRTEEIIGDGFYGTSYKGTDTKLRRSFAIKAMTSDILWGGRPADIQKAKESFLTEMKAFSIVRHPNIEVIYAYAFPKDIRCCSYLVSELAEKGSLSSFLTSDLGPERLSLVRRRIQIALDVMTAIQFLHIGNDRISSCVHGDIKSATIVLKRDFTAQLINCGQTNIAFEDSESKTGVIKEAAGYLCPEYKCGGMQFERSCDIFSFGAVLAELFTGKLQNHKDECDTPCDLDPALGYDTFELPKYLKDFVDLAICCLQPNPNDRLAGETVMEKLWTILSQCCSRKFNTNSGMSVGDSLPINVELQCKDKCIFCLTFPSLLPHSVCAVCKSAQDRRTQMSFSGETGSHFDGTNAKLDASLPLLSRMDIRLNNPVPRLFIIVPFAVKSALTHPKVWLHFKHRTRYYLYFVCIHSMKAIEPPLPIIVTTCWLEKVAPVLAVSLFLLQLGLEPGGSIDLGFSEAALTLKLSSSRIAEILKEVGRILTETRSSDLLVRLRSNKELDLEDIRQLRGDAYELIVEVASEDRGWRDLMEPVRKNDSPQIFWVCKDVAQDTSNDYDIVKV